MLEEGSTRRRILDSAYTLFVEQGYNGSSMRDIARASNVRPASIYNHFESKEHLFESVFSERNPMLRILEVLDSVSGEDAQELLTNAINDLTRQMLSETGLLSLFFIELVEMEAKHIPETVRLHFPRDSAIVKMLYEYSSEIRDVGVVVLLRSLIAFALSHVLFDWLTGNGDAESWGSQEELIDVYLRGVLR